MTRPTQALIDLAAIKHNYQLACQLNKGSCYAVVKANGYGLGAVKVAAYLADCAYGFAVASVEEALELREAGITQRILLLEGVFSEEEVAQVGAHELDVVFHQPQQIDWFMQASGMFTGSHAIVKLNTGMNRLGISASQYQQYFSLKPLFQSFGLMTHLACADEPAQAFTTQQIEEFNQQLAVVDVDFQSVLNSAGLQHSVDKLNQQKVHIGRPGIMLYGSQPCFPAFQQPSLQTVMQLFSEVISLNEISAGQSVGYGQTWTAAKDTFIAVVACGYADGYPRHAPPGTPVAINGRIFSLAGKVSMDMLAVEVDADVKVGDKVELWGKQVNVDEVAQQAGTIAYELFTKLTPRVKKTYLS